MTSREELLKNNVNWIFSLQHGLKKRKKHEVLTYRRENGDLIQHYPDGTEKVIEYAQ